MHIEYIQYIYIYIYIYACIQTLGDLGIKISCLTYWLDKNRINSVHVLDKYVSSDRGCTPKKVLVSEPYRHV